MTNKLFVLENIFGNIISQQKNLHSVIKSILVCQMFQAFPMEFLLHDAKAFAKSLRGLYFFDVAEKSSDPGKFLTSQVACKPKQLLTLLGGEGIFFFFLILSKRSQLKISEQFLQGPLEQTAAREVDQGQQ